MDESHKCTVEEKRPEMYIIFKMSKNRQKKKKIYAFYSQGGYY